VVSKCAKQASKEDIVVFKKLNLVGRNPARKPPVIYETLSKRWDIRTISTIVRTCRISGCHQWPRIILDQTSP